ncbi:ankyrin repeat-containing domain protein [Ilyonectria sp. MPI-CAGE-AT-0026]|nr:ankyrin repeat-containing domain protein [Ilyonectria sp. MPI-CAGE-AT-0026]
MLRQQRESGRSLEVTCFLEELPLPLIGQVVSKESAILEGYTFITIHANHKDMVKFASAEDNAFQMLLGELVRWESQVGHKTQNSAMSVKKERRRNHLWASLRFDQVDARRNDITQAHANTCRWLLQDPGYLDWLDVSPLNQHSGGLWIKGKPGAGKSTLMRFAVTRAEMSKSNEIIISHFFHARGTDLQKSTIGMYRSLLWQLLPNLARPWLCFDRAGLVKHDDSHPIDLSTPQWTVGRLKELFEDAISRVQQQGLLCFIDALDECEESQIRDMMSFFENLTKIDSSPSFQLRVCLASRHYPTITIDRWPELVLDGQQGHSQDITAYIDTRLMIGHSKLANEIRLELQEKASGVFMWVVLVVSILNKEYDSGHMHVLRKRLMDTPGDLHELFRDIMTRDQLHPNELLLCIEWVLYSRRPLNPDELYYAIISGTVAGAIQDLIFGGMEIMPQDFKRFILDSSKGLVEIVLSPRPVVQFIYESVRDFLLKGDGLAELWSTLKTDLQGLGHNLLKQCCATYFTTILHSHEFSRLSVSYPSTKPRELVKQKFPFLEYAVHYVLQHADLAQEEQISQLSFVQSFEWRQWLEISNLLAVKYNRYTPNASLLYIFAVNNLPNLIQAHPAGPSYLEMENERHATPLFASTVTGSSRALRKFMELEVLRQPDVPMLRKLLLECPVSRNRRTPMRGPKTMDRLLGLAGGNVALFLLAAGKDLSSFCETWYSKMAKALLRRDEEFALKLLEAGLDLQSEDAGALILKACAESWEDVVQKILANGNVNIDTVDSRGNTPIMAALRRGHTRIAKMLLDTGRVDVNSQGRDGETALCYAVRCGYTGIVQIVLKRPDININTGARHGGTPLIVAAGKGAVEITALLLRIGKSAVNIKNKFGRSPLSYAAAKGHAEIVSLLLQLDDVEVELKDRRDRSPLSYAAEHGHEAIVALLLANQKVEVNSCDNSGWTPLYYAAARGHEEVMKLLLCHEGSNVNWRDNGGCTALIIAAREGHVATLEILLGRAEIDANIRTRWGTSALSMSRKVGCQAITQILLASDKVVD